MVDGGEDRQETQEIRGWVTFSLRICCHTFLSRVKHSTLECVHRQECQAACTILIWTIEHVLHIHNSIITSSLHLKDEKFLRCVLHVTKIDIFLFLILYSLV